MWSLGMEGGAARRNWAIPVGNLAGGGVEKEEGPTIDRFVASEGWGDAGSWPASGAQRAWPWHASLRRFFGLGGARVALEGWGGRVELLGSTGLRRNKLEEGFLGGARRKYVGACCGLQCRPVHGLRGSGRCAALWAGVATGRGFNATVRDHLALRAHETGYGLVVTSERYDAVQDAARVPRTAGAKGTTTLTSWRWGVSPHGRRGSTAP
jgi:hypothetical protein